MFALGTYVANSSDVKSDQVTSINLSVGTRLLPLMFDASPLVRQVSFVCVVCVCVCARTPKYQVPLHGI